MTKLCLRWCLGAGILFGGSGPAWSSGFMISGATVTLSGTTRLATSGDAFLANGSLVANTSQITIGSSWTITSGSFLAGTSTVLFNAQGSSPQITSHGNPFATVIFNGPGSYWTLRDSMTVLADLTLAAGTLDTGPASSFEISIAGNWANPGGALAPNQSTVTINGTGMSTSTWTGSTNFYSLECTVPGKTLAFSAGFVQTIAGSLILTGSAGSLLRLRSSTPGTFAYLTALGDQTISFVDTKDSNAGGGNVVVSGASSVNSGHNVNWSFGHIAPSNAELALVLANSLSATWDSITSQQGYSLETSTTGDFTGTKISSVTSNGGVMSLALPATLEPNTTYYLRVGALWNDGTTDYINTLPVSTSTLASLVHDLQADTVFTTTATLQWTALPDSPLSESAEGYVVQASTLSTFNGPLISSSTGNTALNRLTVTGLTPGTLYYFRVGSLNWNNVPHFSAPISETTATGDVPRTPCAVWGFLNSIENLFVFSWHAVTLDINGISTVLDHYLIERYDNTEDPPTFTTTVPANSLSYSQASDGHTYFYRVKAVGINGFTSLPSDFVDSSPEANRYVIAADDSSTHLRIPSILSRELLTENDLLGDDLVLQLTRRPLDESDTTLRSYSIVAVTEKTGQPVSHFSFSQAGVTFQIGLSASSGVGRPGSRPSGSTGQIATVYWNNGQTFIPIGSAAPADGSSIAATTRATGIYHVQVNTSDLGHFQLIGGSPYPRVITPHAANNRRVFFFFNIPNNATISGTLYDLQGAKIRDLQVNDQSPASNALVWDGKDDTGTLVHSGVYLYKVTSGHETITGTVVVAR